MQGGAAGGGGGGRRERGEEAGGANGDVGSEGRRMIEGERRGGGVWVKDGALGIGGGERMKEMSVLIHGLGVVEERGRGEAVVDGNWWEGVMEERVGWCGGEECVGYGDASRGWQSWVEGWGEEGGGRRDW